jgi:hypothetical protein
LVKLKYTDKCLVAGPVGGEILAFLFFQFYQGFSNSDPTLFQRRFGFTCRSVALEILAVGLLSSNEADKLVAFLGSGRGVVTPANETYSQTL